MTIRYEGHRGAFDKGSGKEMLESGFYDKIVDLVRKLNKQVDGIDVEEALSSARP